MKFKVQSSKFKVAAAFILLFLMVVAAHAQTKLEVGIPGQKAAGGSVSGPVEYIKYIYLFVFGFVGIAGLITLVMYGAVWTASAVVDKKAMAIEGIKNTLTGLAIAFTAFIILNTINPDLTIIQAPSIRAVDKKPATSEEFFDVKGLGSACSSNSDCAVFGPSYLCRNYRGVVQCIAPKSSLEPTAPSTAQTVSGVAACCYNPTPTPNYQWRCVGGNESMSGSGTGCSRILGAGWETFGATAQGCLDQVHSIGQAPSC